MTERKTFRPGRAHENLSKGKIRTRGEYDYLTPEALERYLDDFDLSDLVERLYRDYSAVAARVADLLERNPDPAMVLVFETRQLVALAGDLKDAIEKVNVLHQGLNEAGVPRSRRKRPADLSDLEALMLLSDRLDSGAVGPDEKVSGDVSRDTDRSLERLLVTGDAPIVDESIPSAPRILVESDREEIAEMLQSVFREVLTVANLQGVIDEIDFDLGVARSMDDKNDSELDFVELAVGIFPDQFDLEEIFNALPEDLGLIEVS